MNENEVIETPQTITEEHLNERINAITELYEAKLQEMSNKFDRTINDRISGALLNKSVSSEVKPKKSLWEDIK